MKDPKTWYKPNTGPITYYRFLFKEPPAPRKPVFVNDPEEQFESEPEDR